MKKIFLIAFSLFLLAPGAEAQFSRYTVSLKDKGNGPYTLAAPAAYLSARAIERRTRFGIALDSTDLPVTPAYLAQIASIPNVTILNVSRWLNQVCIRTTDANAITAIQALPFVQSTQAIAARTSPRAGREETVLPYSPVNARTTGALADYFDYGAGSLAEIRLHKGEFLHNIGLRGQGMQIAMLDAGYLNYTTLRAFDSINSNGQVLSTWDFVYRESSVVEDHAHGMQCLSTIAANIPGQFIGKAPKASFHLFKTEDVESEYPIEEFNWVCGAERSDSTGADVISSSLGYYDFDNPSFDYSYSQMNGQTTIAAKGARLAVRKGLLVFNAIGNSGTSSTWPYLSTPSDADSVLAVGAVNTSGAVWPSSSYGPSASGKVKPDMASVGWQAMIQNTNNTIALGFGTSFACPNMAGLATCLWQGFPEFNNMKIANALRRSGNIFQTPDNRSGYGIPDVRQAFAFLLIDYATSSSSASSCTATISWKSKDVGAMKYEIERRAPGETGFTKVGEQAATTGSLLTNRQYQFTQTLNNVSSGTVSYRIRQIIDTAAASFMAVYIDTTSFTLATSCVPVTPVDPPPTEDIITIVPNPATGSQASLRITTSSAIPRLQVMIYDIKGRLMSRLLYAKEAGSATFPLPLQGLASGEYIIRVYNQDQLMSTQKLIRR